MDFSFLMDYLKPPLPTLFNNQNLQVTKKFFANAPLEMKFQPFCKKYTLWLYMCTEAPVNNI